MDVNGVYKATYNSGGHPVQCQTNDQTIMKLGSSNRRLSLNIDKLLPKMVAPNVSQHMGESTSGVDIRILVGGFNPSENYESQLGLLFPIYGKIKNIPNHQPVFIVIHRDFSEKSPSPPFLLTEINQLSQETGAPPCWSYIPMIPH
jgi:hypothetical protein